MVRTHVAASGHRPPRLGLGYDRASRESLTRFAFDQVGHAKGLFGRELLLISGLAQGWDQAIAAAAVWHDVPFVAAVPFLGQEARWPFAARVYYHFLLGRAEHVEVVCPGGPGGYGGDKFLRRDAWMVDNAHALLCLYDGQAGGGTAYTIKHARGRGVEVVNVWDKWTSWRAGTG